jgi:hypothetical protein
MGHVEGWLSNINSCYEFKSLSRTKKLLGVNEGSI